MQKSKRQNIVISNTKIEQLNEIAQRYEISKPDVIKIAIQKFIEREKQNGQNTTN